MGRIWTVVTVREFFASAICYAESNGRVRASRRRKWTQLADCGDLLLGRAWVSG